MKKLLVMLLALVLVLGTMVASAETAFDNHITVEISMWEIDGFGNDAISDLIQEKFNCEIVPILQEWSDYREKFRLLASSDELPDSFAGYPLSESWFADFVSQEMIRTIPQELIDQYPNVKATCEASQEWKLSQAIFGDIYYIPRMLSAKGDVTADRDGFYYRADWAEKLGYTETPADMETLYDMLYAFAHEDPDGNGQDDTFGYVGNLGILYTGFDAYPGMWVKGEEGAIPGYLDKDAMISALSWLRKAYENGVIDPELSNDVSKWTQGTFGAYEHVLDAYWINRNVMEEFGGANPDLDPLAVTKIITALSAQPGGTPTKGPNLDTSGTCFAYDTTDEELERLLAIYDYLLSDEGNALRYWGIEGEDYSVNEDGSFTKLHDEALRTKYPSIFIQNWPSWDHDFLMDVEKGDPAISTEVKEMALAAREASNAAYDPETSKIDTLAGYISTEEKMEFMFDYDAELVSIITGTEDVEAMYDAFVAKAYDIGVQEVIDSVNAFAATLS